MTKNEVLHDLDAMRRDKVSVAESIPLPEWDEVVYQRHAKTLDLAMRAVQEFDSDEWDRLVRMAEDIDRHRDFDA